jgi:hypothetical protein
MQRPPRADTPDALGFHEGPEGKEMAQIPAVQVVGTAGPAALAAEAKEYDFRSSSSFLRVLEVALALAQTGVITRIAVRFPPFRAEDRPKPHREG